MFADVKENRKKNPCPKYIEQGISYLTIWIYSPLFP